MVKTLARCIFFFLLIISLLITFSDCLAQIYPQKIWDKTIGGNGHEQPLYCDIKLAKDGNLLFVAQSQGGPGGDIAGASNGNEDYWLFKVDTLGNLLWEKGFGGTGSDVVADFIELADGGYILVGSSDSPISGDKTENGRGDDDFWVVRTDSNLNVLWDKTYGGNFQDRCFSVCETSDKGFMLSGSVLSTIGSDITDQPFTINPINEDYWVIKIDSIGNKIWDKRYGWTGGEECLNVKQTPDGNYLLIGWTLSQNGGTISQPKRGSYDYWVVKIDPMGNKIWDKRYGSNSQGGAVNSDNNWHAKLTPDGGFIMGGTSNGDEVNFERSEVSKGMYDYWIIKCDSVGNKQWDRSLGGNNQEYYGGIELLQDGGYLVSGSSFSPVSGDKTQSNWTNSISDYWVVRLRANGTKIWDVRWGGALGDGSSGCAVLNNQTYVSYGLSYSNMSGDKSQNNWSAGQGDLWLVAFTDPPLGYENLGDSKGGLDVFPNPFRETLEVGAEFSEPGKVQIEIFDITGRKVFENNYAISTPFFNKEIELGFLPAGVYSLSVTTASERRTRLVVKR